MSRFGVLLRRELAGYFVGPVAYVLMTFFLGFTGFMFWMLVSLRAPGPGGIDMVPELFGSIAFWMSIVAMVPLITMRLLAEERERGTLESLLTAPVNEGEIALAKYIGAVLFFVALWLPTISYFYVLRAFNPNSIVVDTGALVAAYLGAFLTGSFYISIGLLASALTRNQIVAGMVSFCAICVLFFVGFLSNTLGSELLRELVAYLSSVEHMLDFSRGIVDTRPVTLYLTGSFLMVFLATRFVRTR